MLLTRVVITTADTLRRRFGDLQRSTIGATVLGASVLSMGCSTHFAFPAEWTAIPEAPTRTCEQVAGVYQDGGGPGRGSLSALIFGNEAASPVGKLVSLSFLEARKIQTSVTAPNAISMSRVLRFACKDGIVTIAGKGAWGVGFESPAVGVSRGFVNLDLYGTGSHLIVKERDRALVLIGFVLPAVYHTSNWRRFARNTATQP